MNKKAASTIRELLDDYSIQTADVDLETDLLNSSPIYETFKGNFGDISKVRKYEDLPIDAKKYIERIEEFVGVPIKYIGVGEGREEMIVR